MQVVEPGLAAAIGESQRRQSARCHQEHPVTERGGRHAPHETQPCAAPLGIAGRDSLVGDEQVVQAARPRKPGLEGGVHHARTLVDGFAGRTVGQCTDIAFRGHTDPAREDALEMVRRQTGGACRLGQVGMFLPAITQIVQGFGHARIVPRGGFDIVGMECCARHGETLPPPGGLRHPLLAAGQHVAAPVRAETF